MDLRDGLQMQEPAVFVPWTATVAGLQQLLGVHGLHHVTSGYYVLSDCVPIVGLRCKLGFHFIPRGGDRLHELEFFRHSYEDQAQSFREFQQHFESAFGPPTTTRRGEEGYPTHEWALPGARIIHLVQERFGLEEHVRIQRTGA